MDVVCLLSCFFAIVYHCVPFALPLNDNSTYWISCFVFLLAMLNLLLCSKVDIGKLIHMIKPKELKQNCE